MRRLYIITYDVCDAKRLRKVFRIMRGFGDHLQLSVFRADLSNKERVLLLSKLDEVVHHTEDQVLVFPVGPAGGELEKEIVALGKPYEPSERFAVVV